MGRESEQLVVIRRSPRIESANLAHQWQVLTHCQLFVPCRWGFHSESIWIKFASPASSHSYRLSCQLRKNGSRCFVGSLGKVRQFLSFDLNKEKNWLLKFRLLTIELDHECVCLAIPNPDSAICATCQDVLSCITDGCDTTTMSSRDLPHLRFLLHVETA